MSTYNHGFREHRRRSTRLFVFVSLLDHSHKRQISQKFKNDIFVVVNLI